MANKIDLVNENVGSRQTEQEEIEAFSKYNNLLYFGETSAKDNIMIEETIEGLLKAVHHD